MVRGDKTKLISLRLTEETIETIDELAKEYGITRAMVRAKRLNAYPEIVKAEDQIAETMVDTLPNGTTASHIYIIGAVLGNVASSMLKVGAKEVSGKGGKELRDLIKDALAKAEE
jgi:predicted DNA-binding protein